MTAPLFHIRPATPADLDAVLTLEQATEHAPHWPRHAYLDILAPSPHHSGLTRCLLVAVPQPDVFQVLGFAVASALPAGRGGAPHPAELESLAVAQHARRRGIARALCQAVIEWARTHSAPTLELEVRTSSHVAVSLYHSLNFRETGRRLRYYQHPDDDAILLSLML